MFFLFFAQENFLPILPIAFGWYILFSAQAGFLHHVLAAGLGCTERTTYVLLAVGLNGSNQAAPACPPQHSPAEQILKFPIPLLCMQEIFSKSSLHFLLALLLSCLHCLQSSCLEGFSWSSSWTAQPPSLQGSLFHLLPRQGATVGFSHLFW